MTEFVNLQQSNALPSRWKLTNCKILLRKVSRLLYYLPTGSGYNFVISLAANIEHVLPQKMLLKV